MRFATWVAVFLLFASPAFGACRHGYPSIGREFRSSRAVVIGTVISEREVPNDATKHIDDGTKYKLKIVKTYRGTLPNTFEVLSENNSARFPMEPGKSYLLFVGSYEGTLEVDNCGNSDLLSKAHAVQKKVQSLAAADATSGPRAAPEKYLP